jgi:GNAT superfamily N-acetyltransferase
MAELRAARADDVGGIVDIDPLSPGRAEEIRALVGAGASLVAVDGGQIVGFLAVRPGHFYQRDFIDLLFVAPGSRRQGTGRALLRAALRGATCCTTRAGRPAGYSPASTKATPSTCSSATPRHGALSLPLRAPGTVILRNRQASRSPGLTSRDLR